jgi:hypothetical protein
MTLEEFDAKPYEIPLWQFLKIVHAYTERVKIYVVIGSEWINYKRMSDFWLTENAFKGIQENERTEIARLLEYYADAPVWNVCAEWDREPFYMVRSGHQVTSCITTRVHFSDIKDAYFREKADNERKRKQKYRAKVKAAKQTERN